VAPETAPAHPENDELRRAALASQRLLAPLRGADEAARPPAGTTLAAITGAETDPVRLVIVREPEGGEYLLVFTSVETVRRWRSSARYLAAPGHELFALADRLGVGVLVDRAGPEPLRLEPAADRLLAMPPPDVRALAGPLPPTFLFRLRRVLAAAPEVAEAYVVERAPDGEDILLAAFDVPGVSKEGAEAAAQRLGEAVAPLLPVDLYARVEFLALADDHLSAAVRAADAPVYSRA
jgi:SseB protein N-terminal domain